MLKKALIIEQCIKAIKPYFDSDEELNDFLYTKDHFWSTGQHNQDLSPAEFLLKSRRQDKLKIVIDFLEEMKGCYYE